jgi:hypothetical protein
MVLEMVLQMVLEIVLEMVLQMANGIGIGIGDANANANVYDIYYATEIYNIQSTSEIIQEYTRERTRQGKGTKQRRSRRQGADRVQLLPVADHASV